MANEDVDFTVQFDMRGTLMSMQQTAYNADGQVQKVTTHQLLVDMADAKLFNLVQQKITASGLMVNDGTVLNGQGLLGVSATDLTTTGSVTEYQNFNAAGLAERTVTRVTKPDDRNPGRTTVDELSWSRSYEKRDSLLESKVSGTAQSGSKGGQFKDATSYSQYDAHGNKVLVVEGNELQDSKFKVRQMLYAADGSLLRLQHSEVAKSGEADALTQVKNHLNQVRSGQAVAGRVQQESIQISSNGAYVGDVTVDRGETLPEEHWLYRTSIKDQHFNSGIERTDTQKHTVRSGDTLQSLAQLYYGNVDYWYLIATANGISQSSAQGGPDSQLIEGTTLDIPQRANSFNAHNSFKPMDLQQIIGDTTPNVPYLPPPPPVGCNAMAMVVMIAITVIATIATAGAAAAAMGGQAFTMALGASALTGGVAGGAGIAAAAAGGFVGSVAGQLAGKAMGIVDSFSLKNALASGLTAGATAGMGSMMGVGTAATTVNGAKAAVSSFVSFAKDATHATLNIYGKMAMAASTVGLSVAANKLVGNNQASFQWRNVVIGAVSAGLMDKAGISNTKSVFENFNEGAGLISGFMEGVAGAAIGYGVSKVLYNEGSWNFRNVAIDAFGNAVGNSIVAKLGSKSTAQNEKQANDRGDAAYERARAQGKSPREAELIATREVLATLPSGTRSQINLSESDDVLGVSYLRGDKSKGGLTLTNANAGTSHREVVSWISDEGLWGNNDALNLAMRSLDKRAAVYSHDNIQKLGQQAFAEGEYRGIASTLRTSSRTYNVDLDGLSGGAALGIRAGITKGIRVQTGIKGFSYGDAVHDSKVRVNTYLNEIPAIPDKYRLPNGASVEALEHNARSAINARNGLLDSSRSQLSPDGLKYSESLKKQGLSFEALLEKSLNNPARTNFTYEQHLRAITESSGRSNPLVTNSARTVVALDKVGKASLVTGVALDSYSLGTEINTSLETGNWGNTYQESARIGGAWTGAWVGAKAGAAVGAGFGSFIPVVGTTAGALVGGVAGGIYGYVKGGEIGTSIYNWWN
ncbi:LysM peptidoglycan-binding domain-containing protein [Rheinheimera riviphila]|uniref:LysM peptidoglycan-binding domain-containing protein n=1 Tax=Rheinheimera riviphila TaxID=1834037 RepID=A0A437QRK3_9GAMM|nr:LysM domain-containing protein [Rheinheimera riviphila]RVU37138.1 LysM peptidoglycan-binding domain-containing protein [Rheinheimera riviphila]